MFKSSFLFSLNTHLKKTAASRPFSDAYHGFGRLVRIFVLLRRGDKTTFLIKKSQKYYNRMQE